MTTLWRPVPGYEGRYEVSNDGQVRSLDRITPHNIGKNQRIRGRLLSPVKNDSGYLCVWFRAGRKMRKCLRVHRLVAAAFIPNPEDKPEVNHLDNNPLNNRVENLEWCTRTENLQHMTNQGRRARPMLGKRAPVAILADEEVRELRAAYEAGGISFAKLGERFGVSKRCAMRCAKRESYSDVL